jgi:type II secretory pathway predicted ATPase ExeA
MLLNYFGFRQNPFGSTPDPSCIFLSATHREALATLSCSYLSNRGFTALIAPPGMGKTTLLFRFLDQIRATSKSVFLFDIDRECTPRELLAYILRDLELQVPSTSVEMRDLFKQVLTAEACRGRNFVLVIDEAQNLSDAVLEAVRLMSNFETSQAKLMQVVLAGQPQLEETLSSPSLLQFRQRISFMCRIDPLSSEDTRAYIQERIEFAGYTGGALFTDRALELIAETAQGTPRLINMLCFNALSICRALQKRQVDKEMVQEVLNDQRLGLAPAKQSRSNAPPPPLLQPPAQEVRVRDSPRRDARPRRISVWKSFAMAAALLALMEALGFGVYRIFEAPNVISAAPNIEPTRPAASHIESTQSLDAPFAVRMEAKQSVGSIVKQYLGTFNEERLQQIKALNPWLTDLNHIKAGQQLLLPGPRPTRVENPKLDSGENRKAQ